MSRTSISHAKYGHGVKIKQNKQPFPTKDDIEARSDDISECNIPVRAFPEFQYRGTGFDVHTSYTFSDSVELQSYRMRETPRR